MEEWTAYFMNNPKDDYNLVVDIEYKGEETAFIYSTPQGIELKWYQSNRDLIIPADWLYNLLDAYKKRLMQTKDLE